MQPSDQPDSTSTTSTAPTQEESNLSTQTEQIQRRPHPTVAPSEPYKRPEEPKLDFSALSPLREVFVEEGIRKLVMEEGTSAKTVQSKDAVLYFHETRLQNGQLADFNERRK